MEAPAGAPEPAGPAGPATVPGGSSAATALRRDEGAQLPAAAEPPGDARAWGVVVVLMLIYVNSFLDRSILSLLVDPIRDSLQISESQMGFLMGPAFAVFYIVAGIPLGRLADLVARKWLVFWGQLAWSVMSVGCGLVRSFAPFAALRMGLGVGEASLSPAAYSMITDLFPRHKLARALSVYGLGISIGAGLARILGGVVIRFTEEVDSIVLPVLQREVFSWQLVFFLVAAPTIPLSIALILMREPPRRSARAAVAGAAPVQAASATLGETLRYVWANRATMACHSFGMALLSFSGYGVGAWLPSHFVRNLGWSRAQVGVVLGVVMVITGVGGMLFGGWLADRMHQRGVRNGKMRIALLSCVAWFPFGIVYPLLDDPWLVMAVYAPAAFIGAMPWGIGPAVVQEIMPNRMRGQASAIYLFVINLLGLGFGPQILALCTQYVFGGATGVRWSLLAVPVAAHALSAVLLLLGLKHYVRSLDRLAARRAAG
ncbi:MAG: MFS transporter [Acidobacteria bacterium]|nr:MAG: MFS transporter [Acidobacteriota bacterium]